MWTCMFCRHFCYIFFLQIFVVYSSTFALQFYYFSSLFFFFCKKELFNGSGRNHSRTRHKNSQSHLALETNCWFFVPSAMIIHLVCRANMWILVRSIIHFGIYFFFFIFFFSETDSNRSPIHWCLHFDSTQEKKKRK